MSSSLAMVASGLHSTLRPMLESHGIATIAGDWPTVRAMVLRLGAEVDVLAIDECLGSPEVLHELRRAGFAGRLVYITGERDGDLRAAAELSGADAVFTEDDIGLVMQLVKPKTLTYPASVAPTSVMVDELEANLGLERVWVAGTEITLSRRPWQALAYLLRHRGRVVSSVELGKRAFDQTLDVSTVRDHVRELRRCLGSSSRLIASPRKGGYLIA